MSFFKGIKKKPLEYGTFLTAVIAIIISSISLVSDPKRHSENLTSETIRDVYDEFLHMTDLQAEYPLHSHLFCLREDYEKIVSMVKLDSNVIDPKNELIERSLSNRIMTQFEQSYYLWVQAEDNKDEARAAFMKEVLNYYTQRLLRNPRLLWYWDEEGGNLQSLYEQTTKSYYDSLVQPEKYPADSVGPFSK